MMASKAILSVLSLSVSITGLTADFSPEQLDFFEKKIRPVLAEKCYGCHSADSEKLKGHLQVDHREHLLTGGDSGPSVIPGDPEGSFLVEVMSYQTPDLQMPPKEKLADSIVDDFRKWIAEGAAWPEETVPMRDSGATVEKFDLEKRRAEHWCWRPVTNPQPPTDLKDADWPRDEIDRFILKKIEAAGLEPAAPADKRTWLRRVTFDLIGLPPTREEIAEFLADNGGNAHEKVVDRLLASPHFGEKWARHWMDLVRYAETYGHEFDYPIDYAFEYRDYLIRALNADLPYDEFVTEHVAGDLLDEPRRHPVENFNESILGTAFWYFHEATHAPTDVRQDEADRMDNQIDVFGKSFLGLTIACARCHDHKFDAISTADYYALTAYIESSARQEFPMDPGRKREEAAKRLKALQTEADGVLKQLTVPESVDPGRYFPVAAALVRETKATIPAGDPWGGEMFEDFEDGTYSKWTVKGNAFGKTPAKGARKAQKLEGDFGKRFANSFASSDKPKGTLISKKFVIERPFINFLIAGGKSDTTAAELWVEGKFALRTSGENHDRLTPQAWDVSAFRGKEAEIRVVDNHSGGWGHIEVDRIMFSDAPANGREQSVPNRESITAAATKQGLDADKLEAWCRLFAGNPKKDRTPSGFFAAWLDKPEVARGIQSLQQRHSVLQKESAAKSTLYADFTNGLPDGWSASGFAFQPVAGDTTTLSFTGKTARLASPGTISSSLLGETQTGVLRSPTFEIPTRQIHVLARAENLFTRVVMANYHMQKFNALLFRGTLQPSVKTEDEYRWFTFSGNLDKYIGENAFLEFIDKGGAVADIREIRFSDDGPPPLDLPALLKLATAPETVPTSDTEMATRLTEVFTAAIQDLKTKKGTSPDSVAFLNWMLETGLISLNDLSPELARIHQAGRKISTELPAERYALTMAEGTPEDSYVYLRGSHRKAGETVPRRQITALGGEQGDRLTLAKTITDPENPLTSRVIVNRIWHHLFGRGIVASVDDFGPMGQEPSHPELLDYLATDLMKNGWSLKHTIRKLTLSQTYRQSSNANPQLGESIIAESDPQNILLHRMPVRRLPAESIRDSILAVSGRLDPTLYGPSIPTHRTEFMTGRGGRGSGPLDGAGRRSIYGSIYRNFLSPLMLTFDMPGPFGPKGRRSVSNVPAQSLALMNDPFIIEQAKIWAANSASETDPNTRIGAMFESALGKQPTSEELSSLTEFLKQQAATYGTPEPDERAWADVAHVIFNLKDFVYVN